MILFSLLVSAAVCSLQDKADKILRGVSCEDFRVKFSVSKKQLYASSYPRTNTFVIGPTATKKHQSCRRQLESVLVGTNQASGSTWYEQRQTVWLDFFDENDYENCGSTVSQTEFGIKFTFEVSGKPSASAIITTEIACFWPTVKADEIPSTYDAYLNGGTATAVSGNRIEIKKLGNMSSERQFDLYDVRTNMTQKFYPFRDSVRLAQVGQPMLVGVWPKPEWKQGKNINQIYAHSSRWNYFIRDCYFSGIDKDAVDPATDNAVDIQLIKRNCKNARYHIQQLSKYGRKDDGHLMMFEAIAFNDREEHYLTCDVDVCLALPTKEWRTIYTQNAAQTDAYADCGTECHVEVDASNYIDFRKLDDLKEYYFRLTYDAAWITWKQKWNPLAITNQAVKIWDLVVDSTLVGIVTEDNFFGLSRSASFLKTLLDGQPDSEPNFSDVPIPGVGSESTERYFSVGYREILTGGENAGFFESAAVSTLEIQEINSVHTWSDCYQPCVGDQWLSQGTDESVFELSTVIPPLGSSVEPITVNYVTDASDDVVATQATAATELNYTNDLDQAKEECLAIYTPSTAFKAGFFTTNDENLMTLCGYISQAEINASDFAAAFT